MRCLTPKYVWPKGRIIPVGCGKCLVCLSNKRQDWCFRLEEEWKRSERAAFITLTYHPRFYPDTGVQKKHFQLFMKRLRFHSNEKLRYYAVGEYGTKTGRAHYHAIIFNFQGGEDVLQRAWSVDVNGVSTPLGIVHIGKVNSKSIRYATKYIIQRGAQTDKKLNPPFALMSRRFGLGLWYLTDEMVAWHRSGGKNYTIVDGQKARLPRYFKNFIWPHEWQKQEVSKKSAEAAKEAELKNRQEVMNQGYTDPDKIIDEMRSIAYGRIKQKIAYTQKF